MYAKVEERIGLTSNSQWEAPKETLECSKKFGTLEPKVTNEMNEVLDSDLKQEDIINALWDLSKK